MIYRIAERFKSVQGEGLFTGTPMAFIRFVGCSVGKTICHHCDTDFDKTYEWIGGGEFDVPSLFDWIGNYTHICLTGGEPLDQDLFAIVRAARDAKIAVHVETSGTKVLPDFLDDAHVCVSPKPGFLEPVVEEADEVKVIVPGLGNGPGWPTLQDALRWAEGHDRPVFLQPRNAKHDISTLNLALCEKLVNENPTLRLSVQMHKILRVR